MGTGNSRWMFNPAPASLSMVQIAPDNQDKIWKADYEYTIENIMGFNHFSDWTMTGFLMQPTCGELQVNPGREDYPDEGYRSRIDKRSERAEIGRYSVFMTDTKIQAEITATRRAALQRYRFPARKDARILIDLFTPNEYPHNLVSAKVRKVSDTEIEGEATYYNAFTDYSLEQSYTLHFVLQFSKPFESMGGWVNEGVKPVTGYIPGWNRNHQFETKLNPHDIASLEGHGDMASFLNYTTHADERSWCVRAYPCRYMRAHGRTCGGVSQTPSDGLRRIEKMLTERRRIRGWWDRRRGALSALHEVWIHPRPQRNRLKHDGICV